MRTPVGPDALAARARHLLHRLGIEHREGPAAGTIPALAVAPDLPRMDPAALIEELERVEARCFLTLEAVALLGWLAGPPEHQLTLHLAGQPVPLSVISQSNRGGLPVGAPLPVMRPLANTARLRVLVTGATGFLGGVVVQMLVVAGANVLGTGRCEAKGKKVVAATGARFIAADLSDAEAVKGLCAGQDAVVHCAAECRPWPSTWSLSPAHYNANVLGTANIVSGCAAAGARLVHISTPSLYYEPGSTLSRLFNPLAEWVPIPPHHRQPTAYAATKMQAEVEVQRAVLSGLCAVVLRPRGIIGVGDRHLLPRIETSLAQRRLPVFRPDAMADLTSVENVGHAVQLALRAPVAVICGRTFNITNDEPVRVWAILRQLCATRGHPLPCIRIPHTVLDLLARCVELTVHVLQSIGVLSQSFEPKLTRYAVSTIGSCGILDVAAARRDLDYEPLVSTQDTLAEITAGAATRCAGQAASALHWERIQMADNTCSWPLKLGLRLESGISVGVLTPVGLHHYVNRYDAQHIEAPVSAWRVLCQALAPGALRSVTKAVVFGAPSEQVMLQLHDLLRLPVDPGRRLVVLEEGLYSSPAKVGTSAAQKLFGLCCIVQLIIVVLLGDIAHDLLALQLEFDPSIWRERVRGWSDAQLFRLQAHFVLDAWYPIIYGLFLVRRLQELGPASQFQTLLCGFAITAAVCDILENSLYMSALYALAALENAPDWLITASSMLATTKWALVLPTLLYIQPFQLIAQCARNLGLRLQ